jgi:hypothetical protein
VTKLDQVIEPLEDVDSENLEKARNWVRDHYEPQARKNMKPLKASFM